MNTLPNVVPVNLHLSGIQTTLFAIRKMRESCLDVCQDMQRHIDQISVRASRMTSPRQLPIVQAMQADCASHYSEMQDSYRTMGSMLREHEKKLLRQLATCQINQDKVDEMLLRASTADVSGDLSYQDILDLGASVNHRSPEGETPLHLAARRGQEKAVDLLLQAGADERARTPAGMDPVDLLDGPHTGIRLLLKQASDRRRERASDRRHCGWITILRKRHNAGVAGGDGGGVGARPAKLRRSSRLAQGWGAKALNFLLSGAPDDVFKKIIGFL